MEQGVWQEIGQLYQKFQKLGINEAVDYDKYYRLSLKIWGIWLKYLLLHYENSFSIHSFN